MLKDEPLLSPTKIGIDGANIFPSTIKTSVDEGLLHPDPVHYVTKHLQQGIESDHFRVKKNMPKIGGLQSFNTARQTIAGFEAMLWLRKGFGFSGGWTVNDQNDLLARLSDSKRLTKHKNRPSGANCCLQKCLRHARLVTSMSPSLPCNERISGVRILAGG
ncbi:hypothetical protein JOH51_007531 [Rhizobium leguminosarum]|nr:hypothetical protein [Rhizobium leguminosarum]